MHKRILLALARTSAVLGLALLIPGRALATVDYDLNAGNNYLKSYTGQAANSYLYACAVGDFNGDGIDDVAMVGYTDSTQGRTANGALYIAYGLHKTTGTTNLGITGSFNVRVDGASTNDNLANCWAADVNNDGQTDLIVRSDAINTLYVLLGPFPNGVGNIFDLANSAAYNTKIIVPGGYGEVYPTWADLNGDGVLDTLIEVPNAPTNGANAGSLYVLNGPMPGGTGNVRDLSLGSNFNLRVDGGSGDYLTSNSRGSPYWTYNGLPTTIVADVNGDGAPDLITGAEWDSSWNRGSNGLVIVSTGPFPATTGNIWRTSDSGRWMVRFGGANNNAGLSRSLVADLNGDGINDLCVGEGYGDSFGRTDNGVVYCIYGPINYPIDTQIDLAVPQNWNIALSGAASSDNMGFNSIRAADLNGDGVLDLILESEWFDFNGAPPYDTGAIYVINGGTTNFTAGLAQSRDLASISPYYYNLKLSHNEYYSHLGYAPTVFRDMDGDGQLDIVATTQGENNSAACGSGIGYVAVLYGPTPNTTGNFYDVGASNVDARFHFSNCALMNSFTTMTGDFDGDGMQDVILSDRGFNSNQGRVFLTAMSTAAPRITAPGLFTNLTAPTIQWSAVSGASNYRLQLDVDPRFPSPLSDQTVTVTQASVSGLVNGQGYYARVKATNGNFQRWGPIATFTVDTTPPVPPTLIQPGDASGSNPTVGTQTPLFKWTDASPE